MTKRHGTLGLVVLAAATMAAATSARADDRTNHTKGHEEAAGRTHPVVPRNVSDTLPKSERGKPERATPPLPAAKKKAAKQPRIIFPSESPTTTGRIAPDQPWETTFLVRTLRSGGDPSLRQVTVTYEP